MRVIRTTKKPFFLSKIDFNEKQFDVISNLSFYKSQRYILS